MLYTEDFWRGKSFVTAFAGCDASNALVLGSVVSLVITVAPLRLEESFLLGAYGMCSRGDSAWFHQFSF